MDDFPQRLRERIAQQAPLRYNADQLKRMREQAVEREPDYQRRFAEINDNLRQNRFRKHAQLAVFCGYTKWSSKEGPGQSVYVGNDKQNNKTFKRRSRAGRLLIVGAAHINFRTGYSEASSRIAAEQRYNQARALESLELSGGMSKSEAVMAARHATAWKAAVSIAKDKENMYAGNDVKPTLRAKLVAQAAAQEIFLDYKTRYNQPNLHPEGIAHALSFYKAWNMRFPDDWSQDDHLDFYVFRYSELMTRQRGALAGTIEEINHESNDHIDAVVSIARDIMNSPRLAQFQQHIINGSNYRKVSFLSLIAREDAMPPEYLVDDYNAAAFLESTATYDNSQAHALLTNAETEQQNFVSQPSWAPPTDFTHWDTWIRVFYPELEDVAQIPYYSPRVSLADTLHNPEESIETQSVKIKLRQIERLFAQWRDDVVVFLALDKIRLAAAAGDYEEMCLLAQRVNMMMGVQDADPDEDVLEVDEMPKEQDNVADDLFEELSRAEESEEEEEEEKVVEDDSDEEDDEAMRH